MSDLRANNGGARAGAGRRPVKDKRQSIPVWLRTSVIKSKGGRKSVQKKVEKILIKEGWDTE